jgi:hypothetical protein
MAEDIEIFDRVGGGDGFAYRLTYVIMRRTRGPEEGTSVELSSVGQPAEGTQT